MTATDIEWTDRVWNPTTGCTKVSAGCQQCYAESIAKRFWGDRKFSDVQFHEDRLLTPLTWKKPAKIFVNSMSDLFHDDVTDEQIDQVFAVMTLAHWHTFQILTKRPERMMVYSRTAKQRIRRATVDLGRKLNRDIELFETCEWDYPLPNIWLGISVENQKAANERIPLLRHTLAAVHFLSCEPLLEKISIFDVDGEVSLALQKYYHREMMYPADFINWVIIGGESGSKARECHIDWIRSLVQECQPKIPVFVKQLGRHPIIRHPYIAGVADAYSELKLGNIKGNDINEFPEDLRIREFPEI